MFHRNLIPNPPARLRSPKNDIAPMIFFPDILLSSDFLVPVLPVPMRIDCLTNGLPTLLIMPDFERIANFRLNDDSLIFNFKTFITIGLRNFVFFGQKKYKEITYRPLDMLLVKKWFTESLALDVKIPTLIDEFTFIIIEFLNLIQKIKGENLDYKDESYVRIIESYSGNMLEHFREKLTKNSFTIYQNGKFETFPIFKEKKGKYFPEIISFNVVNERKKSRTMNIVPYLIYDDFIDCYSFNKFTATVEGKKIINLSLFYQYGIIEKGNTFTEPQRIEKLSKFDLKNLSFESIVNG